MPHSIEKYHVTYNIKIYTYTVETFYKLLCRHMVVGKSLCLTDYVIINHYLITNEQLIDHAVMYYVLQSGRESNMRTYIDFCHAT